MSAPVYRGRFGREQAERLLWRAGFGPRPGEADRLAKLGLRRAVLSLTRPKSVRLVGKPPRNDRGLPLAPNDAYGDDQLWWLDRMVRTNAPLIERMTLVWHDWFATSNDGVGSQRLMVNQNQMLRRHALGSFRDLLLDVTKDPAMLMWLSGYVEPEGRAERELRARADGALHARRRSRRLHGAGRPRAGAGADGLGRPEGRRPDSFCFRTEWHDAGHQDDLRQEQAISTGATPASCA